MLDEVGRVLRPGGRLVVGLVPLDCAWGRSHEGKGRAGHLFYRHARFQTLTELRRMLATARFRPVEARSILFQAPRDKLVAEPVRGGVVAGTGFATFAARREDAGVGCCDSPVG